MIVALINVEKGFYEQKECKGYVKHTYSHSHTIIYTRRHTIRLTQAHTSAHTHTDSHTHSDSHTLTLKLTHTHTDSHTYTHTHTHTQRLTLGVDLFVEMVVFILHWSSKFEQYDNKICWKEYNEAAHNSYFDHFNRDYYRSQRNMRRCTILFPPEDNIKCTNIPKMLFYDPEKTITEIQEFLRFELVISRLGKELQMNHLPKFRISSTYFNCCTETSVIQYEVRD